MQYVVNNPKSTTPGVQRLLTFVLNERRQVKTTQQVMRHRIASKTEKNDVAVDDEAQTKRL
jgi:hypothetical protein